MGSFTERAGAYRRDNDARFRAMINDAARPSFLTEEQREIARLKSINHFNQVGLYDFLMDSVSHARSVDGHHDARIEFDLHEAGRGVDRIVKEDDSLERRLLLTIVRAQGTVATAEVRWDIVPGEGTNGYTYYRVDYFPEQPRRVIVRGREEVADIFLDFWNIDEDVNVPEDQVEEGLVAAFNKSSVEDAIIKAYFDPATQQPLARHPENERNEEPPPPPQSSQEGFDMSG